MLSLTPLNRNSVYNIFDDFFNDSFFMDRKFVNDSFRIDVKENEKEYLVEAELPGVKKEEIKVDYCENKLLIKVNHSEEVNNDKDDYIHRERRQSSLARQIYLRDVDIDKIEATLDQGILTIHAPKKEILENRTSIEVK